MSSYSDKLKDPRWQKKRLEIMQRDKWRCKLCGDTETQLQVHHKEYINGNDPWDYPNKMLVTICEHCHKEISGPDFKGADFNTITVYKSDGWKRKSRIMFVSRPSDSICAMCIYDENDNFLCGYNLRSDIPNIIRILKHSIKTE